MKTQPIGCQALQTRMLAFLSLVIVLLLSACTPQPQPARIEEITFESGSFHVVGDLRLPEGDGPFPIVLFVHGSGPATRTEYLYLPIMERMLQAGYATFAWDKPGTGESTGQFSERTLRHQRAQIILDAIAVMKARRDIDPQQIGLWGISQAGYVMWNPIEVVKQVRIPVLAIFGDKDPQIDPIQGAYAYREALQKAGNPLSRVELFPRANHGIVVSETGCPADELKWLEQYVRTLGYESVSEALEAIREDPYNAKHSSAIPYAPGYLDLIEEWLKGLPR